MRHSSFWQAVGFGVSTLVGTLLQFLYDWTGENTLATVFSGVNESTWEHMKLLYFPLFLFAVVQHFFFRQPGFWWVKLGGTFLGLVLIPVLFYTLSGVFGKTSAAVNIGIFFLSAAAVFSGRNSESGKPELQSESGGYTEPVFQHQTDFL